MSLYGEGWVETAEGDVVPPSDETEAYDIGVRAAADMIDDSVVEMDTEAYGQGYPAVLQFIDSNLEKHKGHPENRKILINGVWKSPAMFASKELYDTELFPNVTQEGRRAVLRYIGIVEEKITQPDMALAGRAPRPIVQEKPVIRRHVAADPWKAAAGDFEEDD